VAAAGETRLAAVAPWRKMTPHRWRGGIKISSIGGVKT
jgi:hypothetical protein